MSSPSALNVRSLTVIRDQQPILREIDFRVRPGECVAMIGPNGAGKTTLLQTLIGQHPPEQGEVEVNGRRLGELSRRQIARSISYLPQQVDGFEGFRVRDVVESGRFAYLAPFEPLGAGDRAAVEQSVQACRIEPLLDRTLETLSGGERQKVWLAAALAQQSPVLLLDEPTTALDPAHFVDLMRILQRLTAEGKTLVIVCHDLNIPTLLHCRVLGLRQGRLLADLPAEEYFRGDHLRELFDCAFDRFPAADALPALRPRIS